MNNNTNKLLIIPTSESQHNEYSLLTKRQTEITNYIIKNIPDWRSENIRMLNNNDNLTHDTFKQSITFLQLFTPIQILNKLDIIFELLPFKEQLSKLHSYATFISQGLFTNENSIIRINSLISAEIERSRTCRMLIDQTLVALFNEYIKSIKGLNGKDILFLDYIANVMKEQLYHIYLCEDTKERIHLEVFKFITALFCKEWSTSIETNNNYVDPFKKGIVEDMPTFLRVNFWNNREQQINNNPTQQIINIIDNAKECPFVRNCNPDYNEGLYIIMTIRTYLRNTVYDIFGSWSILHHTEMSYLRALINCSHNNKKGHNYLKTSFFQGIVPSSIKTHNLITYSKDFQLYKEQTNSYSKYIRNLQANLLSKIEQY